MRINSNQPTQNTDSSELVKRQQEAPQTVQSAATRQDKASISSQARSLSQNQAASPEVRQDRVDSIKQAMAAGTYKVSNQQLAGAMFSEFFNKS